MKKEFQNTRNPILPTQFHVPDSEAHVMPDGSVYVYGSYDLRDDVYCSGEYHVVSSPDMEHWTIYDESLNGEDVPWIHNDAYPHYPGIDWTHPTPFINKMIDAMMEGKDQEDMKAKFEDESKPKPKLLFAPDCIYKDGKYYLYFCSADDQEGVAVSDKPEGPFTDIRQLPCGGIDPAIFIDDDGSAYYYWGQLFSHGVKLNDDMISFDPAGVVDNLVTEEEHFFHEGSSMRKIGDNYYYVYADMQRNRPTQLGYSMGKSPLGPFTYKGIIIDNGDCDPQSWNNHGSIECVNGQWYIFYHRCSRNTQMYRRLCVEKININQDGTIDEVKMTTQGTGAPMNAGERIEGFRACGVYGGAYIDVIDPEDWSREWLVAAEDGSSCIFRYVQSPSGFKSAKIEGCGKAGIEVYLDDQKAGAAVIDGNGEIPLENCGTGEKTLKLVFKDPKKFRLAAVTLE